MVGKQSKGVKKQVKIEDIYFEQDLYPRTKPNWMTIVDYKESMVTGAKFPPIVLATHHSKLFLVDGKHRVECHRQLGIAKIDAIIYTGWSKQKIFQEAVRLNISHGEKLTPYEKRKIAQKLLEMKMKKQDVSDLIQVSMDKLDNFIGSRLVNAITGEPTDNLDDVYETGQVILKSSLKHLAGGNIDGQSLAELQKQQFSRDQSTLLKELISLLETKTIDTNDEDIMKLLAKVKTLLRKYKFI